MKWEQSFRWNCISPQFPNAWDFQSFLLLLLVSICIELWLENVVCIIIFPCNLSYGSIFVCLSKWLSIYPLFTLSLILYPYWVLVLGRDLWPCIKIKPKFKVQGHPKLVDAPRSTVGLIAYLLPRTVVLTSFLILQEFPHFFPKSTYSFIRVVVVFLVFHLELLLKYYEIEKSCPKVLCPSVFRPRKEGKKLASEL